MNMYAQRTRVTSKYPYKLQFNKHVSSVALPFHKDILTDFTTTTTSNDDDNK